MKKIMILLVSLIVVAAKVEAQVYVIADDHATITLSNGYRYDKGTVPGGPWMGVGTNFTTAVNEYLTRVYLEDGVEAYNAALIRWQTARPVGISTTTITTNPMAGVAGMMGGTMMMTGGNNGMMMLGGMPQQNAGAVWGAGGVAGAKSQLEITNSNMLGTLGSGTQVYTDLNGNVQVGGDVLMGLARVASAIGGSKKSKNSDGTRFVDNAGNEYILSGGVLYRVQRVNTTPTTTVPTTTTTTTTGTTSNGFVTGYK